MSASTFVSNSNQPSNPKKRCYDRRRISNALEKTVAELCAQAEVSYSGVQKSLAPNLPTLALFSNSHGTTCAPPVAGLSVEAIREKVGGSDAKWVSCTNREIADANLLQYAINAQRRTQS